MTDVQLAYSFIKALETAKAALPSTPVPYTITALQGRRITVNGSPGSSWINGVLEVTSGPANHMQHVICDVQGPDIELLMPVAHNLGLAVGDTVSLTPGPLKTADISKGDPMSIEASVENGVLFFITVSHISGDLTTRSFKGDRRSFASFTSEYGFEVTVETPHTTGVATEDASIRAEITLPTLLHQVAGLIVFHFMDAKMGLMLPGGLSYAYAIWERAGFDKALKAGIIEFNVTSN